MCVCVVSEACVFVCVYMGREEGARMCVLCGDIVCNVTCDGEGCCVVVLFMMVWMKVWVE